MKRHTLLFALSAALMLAHTAPASAQVMPENRVLLKISPIGPIFNTFKGGLEFVTTPNLAIDATINHDRQWLRTDINITTAMIGARYYPTAAFEGYSVAGHLGGIQIDAGEGVSSALLNIELAYSWLVDEARRLYVGTGAGAMGVYALGMVTIPNVRLQIGYRF
jgi:hypothetical protein